MNTVQSHRFQFEKYLHINYSSAQRANSRKRQINEIDENFVHH